MEKKTEKKQKVNDNIIYMSNNIIHKREKYIMAAYIRV